jgi:hypothetical protein
MSSTETVPEFHGYFLNVIFCAWQCVSSKARNGYDAEDRQTFRQTDLRKILARGVQDQNLDKSQLRIGHQGGSSVILILSLHQPQSQSDIQLLQTISGI